MAKDIYDSFIDIVSGMRNFKSYAGKKFQLVDFNNEQITVHDVKKDEDIELSFDDIMNGLSYDDGERTAANLKECMPATVRKKLERQENPQKRGRKPKEANK